MLNGPIFQSLVIFALPLLGSNPYVVKWGRKAEF